MNRTLVGLGLLLTFALGVGLGFALPRNLLRPKGPTTFIFDELDTTKLVEDLKPPGAEFRGQGPGSSGRDRYGFSGRYALSWRGAGEPDDLGKALEAKIRAFAVSKGWTMGSGTGGSVGSPEGRMWGMSFPLHTPQWERGGSVDIWVARGQDDLCWVILSYHVTDADLR